MTQRVAADLDQPSAPAALGAKEALPALRQALAREAVDYGGRMRRAIDKIEGG